MGRRRARLGPRAGGGRPTGRPRSRRCGRSGRPRAIPGRCAYRPCCRCGCRGPASTCGCGQRSNSNCWPSVHARWTARLAPYRRELKKRLYGRTKPGTLLTHHIPLKTDRWDVAVPGFTEIDLVAHCGNYGEGEFVHSLNLTDIHTAWGEPAAVLGKSQLVVPAALAELREALPFRLQGIDSDNGSEFINQHLYDYCQAQEIQFTRGRAYKKDDNAHIEQKNWTHVRKLLGYVRYDSPAAQAAIHDLYRNELRLFQNFFLPSVKLLRKERMGSRVRRRYDRPRTPLERVVACPEVRPEIAAQLLRQRDRLDPFALARTIDQKLERIYALANPRHSTLTAPATPVPVRRVQRQRPSLAPRPSSTSRRVTSQTAR